MRDSQGDAGDAKGVLLKHVAKTLPDSLSERKTLLYAMWALMSEDHPAYRSVEEQIRNLESAEELQKELPLKFTEGK